MIPLVLSGVLRHDPLEVVEVRRKGAGPTTSIITTSNADEFDENVRASWEYEALESAG